jgi:hypothetical protein
MIESYVIASLAAALARLWAFSSGVEAFFLMCQKPILQNNSVAQMIGTFLSEMEFEIGMSGFLSLIDLIKEG